MPKIAMLRHELRSHRQEIASPGQCYGARRIRMFGAFGSVARGEDNTDSDIDFLVDFPRGYGLFKQRLPLTEQLAALFRRSVEVVPEHEPRRHIHDQVLNEAIDL